MNGFFSAVQFLTRIPVPEGDYKLERAYVWFAPVGLLLGAVLAIVDVGLRALPLSSLVISALLFTVWEAITGALHADGLMDTCDAVFAHASPERRLEIMRDPRAGAFGVTGMICVALLKVAALDALPTSVRSQTLVLAPGLGRWAITFVSTAFPYARPTGLGAPLKAAATARALAVASIVPIVVCLVTWPAGAILGALALLMAWVIGRMLTSVLAGLTGDCYGAICELVETMVVLIAVPLAHALG